MRAPLILLSLLVCPTLAEAASILKCVDEQGHVTFTQKVCPPGTRLSTKLEPSNPAPSGDGPPVQMADPEAYPPPSRDTTADAPAPNEPPVQELPADPPASQTVPPYPETPYYDQPGVPVYPPYGGYPQGNRPPHHGPRPPRPPVEPPQRPAQPSIRQQARDNVKRHQEAREAQRQQNRKALNDE